jgi:hypothetical protein
MKNYITPEIEIIKIASDDIITTSPGTQGPVIDSDEGIWDLNT